ncbi:unnamed protein product [Candidula unifasciata]|uniref:Fibrinogen C-terminal domain-containing protein n=1 Tax=Candidula unifasciata TaxID=100452 RepID=A0A8S3ZXS4_9EUPU|nr:unnamed protein product [Candidula unifasciata]
MNLRNQLECFTACSRDNGCSGTLISARYKSCYKGKACTLVQACPSSDPDFRYYNKESPNSFTTTSSATTTTRSSTTTPDQPTSTSTTFETSTTGSTTTPDQTSSSTFATSTTSRTTTPDQPTSSSTTFETSTAGSTTTPDQTTSSSTTFATSTAQLTTAAPFCQNAGTQVSPATCDCSGTRGWVGNRCERRPYSCSELSNFGYTSGTQVFPIDIHRNNSKLVNTACNVGSNSEEVGLLKHTGQFNYNRSWDDYVNGFFYNGDNYWLGLENIYAYNKKGYANIGIHLIFSSAYVNGKVYKEYYSFSISDNTTGYSYTVGTGASGSRSVSGSGNTKVYDLGDPFNPCQNTPFSTHDKDQDLEPTKNCAQLTATGWWFKTCTPEPIVSPLGSVNATSNERRVILPKYDTTSQGPREAFKYVYIYLIP